MVLILLLFQPFLIKRILALFSVIGLFILIPQGSYATRSDEVSQSQEFIDYRSQLNPRFYKSIRKVTRFIIVHTSECDLKTTLKLVSKGKQNNGRWVSRGGHAHYVIAPDGKTFLILDDKYSSNHAGISMWNGTTCLNSCSVGIEFVGYHNKRITKSQYESVKYLIRKLKKKYRLQDRAILTHSQVAYSKPNEWALKNHRGRKYCASNFIRKLAGLNFSWSYDPDVKAGRVLPDTMLSAIFYKTELPVQKRASSNIIDGETSAWAIAGKNYDDANTLYRFPNGWVISGNRIASRIGWDSIPDGTYVYCD
jgi:N-acetyl-anhydromuramyl-L-alanine amidase AmpD